MKRIFIFPTIEEAKAFILTQPRDPVFVAGVGAAEIAAATIRAVKARKPQLVVLAGIAGAYDRSLKRGEVVEVVTERIAGIPARYAREYETTGPDLGLPLAAGVSVNRSGDGLRERPQEKGGRQEDFAAETASYAALQAARMAETKSGDGTSDAAEQALQPAGTSENRPEQPSDTLPETGNTKNADGQTALPGTGDTKNADEQTALPAIGDMKNADGQTALPGTGDTKNADGQTALPEIENMEGAAFFAVCEALGVACCQIRAVSNYVGEPFGRWAVGQAVENLTATLTQIFGNDE